MLDLHGKKHAWILGGFEYLRADTDVEANPGSGGAVFKGDADAGGSIHPYTKVEFGASGTQTPVSATNPLPVGGSGAAALGKAEDAAHTTGDVGVPALAVRRDAEAVGSGTDGDYSTLNVDSSGRLRVNASGVNQPVTDAGGSLTIDTPQLPSAVGQNAAADSLSVVLASDHGGLPAGTNNIGDVDIASALPAGDNNIGNVDIASALPAGDNNIGNVDIASHPAGSLAGVTAKTSDYDTGAGTDTVPMMGLALPGNGGAVQGGTSSNPVRTDPTGTTNQPVTDGGGSLTTDFEGQSTPGSAVPAAGVAVTGSDGTDARHIRTDTDGHLQTDVLTLPNVTLAAGTNTNEVVGDAAHGAAVAGNPVLAGLEARSSTPTAVDSGDVVRAIADLIGRLVTAPYSIPENLVAGSNSSAITDTTSTQIIAAGGAGVRNYITHVIVTNADADTDTVVELRSAATVVYRGLAKAGSGFSITFPAPLRLGDNEALNAACVTTGATVWVSASGYRGP